MAPCTIMYCRRALTVCWSVTLCTVHQLTWLTRSINSPARQQHWCSLSWLKEPLLDIVKKVILWEFWGAPSAHSLAIPLSLYTNRHLATYSNSIMFSGKSNQSKLSLVPSNNAYLTFTTCETNPLIYTRLVW